jgi:hypothetical protein
MKLTEAIASGKRFARATEADIGEYLTAEEFLESGLSLDDYNATDYELEPEVSATLKMTTLVDAWNTAKGTSTSIAQASASPFFSRFVAQLKSKGITVDGGVSNL